MRGSARLATAMDPRFVSLLTLTVDPGNPDRAKLAADGRFRLPAIDGLLRELKIFIAEAAPTARVFRTNHASKLPAAFGSAPQGSRPVWSRS
jgi:hypothetical protein